MRTLTYCFILFLMTAAVHAQTAWPASPWSSAVNLTAVMDTNGILDLSGLHYNPVNNRLYAVQGDGRLRVLSWNTATNTFTQLASKTLSGGPEGITQVNLSANEFYVIDENNYEIKRYTHNASFSTVTEFRHWDLLASPSPMEDTGNTGPEGIVFVPDSALSAIGFRSQQTGQLYTSTKGLGGLLFIAHQDEGYVWAFDINPNTNNDFLYVGKYQTSQSESTDLTFDRTTGLLYILHNIASNNTVEVTDLSSVAIGSGERKFVTTSEYQLADPNDANENIEGFALTPKCSSFGSVSVWLARDVESNEDDAIQQDALRWFMPFEADGNCLPLANDDFNAKHDLILYPNPASSSITVSGNGVQNAAIKIYNSLGQLILKKENQSDTTLVLDVATLNSGIYFLEVSQNESSHILKFSKQ